MIGVEAVVRLIDVLEHRGIEYMLVGSLSSNLYGIPRSTKDADFVLALPASQMGQLARDLGEGFRLDPQISFETLTGTTRRVIHSPHAHFLLETFQLSDDPFDQERFVRRIRISIPLLERVVPVPTAEDVVIMKLRWSRPKDLEDALGVLAVQGSRLDWPHLEKWTTAHGTRNRLEELKAKVADSGAEDVP